MTLGRVRLDGCKLISYHPLILRDIESVESNKAVWLIKQLERGLY